MLNVRLLMDDTYNVFINSLIDQLVIDLFGRSDNACCIDVCR